MPRLVKIVKILPDMRRETVTLVQRATAGNLRAYVLVNNRSEGNAPATVQALFDQFQPKGSDHHAVI